MNEIKPCPFCGGEGYYSYIGNGICIVKCFECEAEVQDHMTHRYDAIAMKAAREYVIRKWNRRVEP